MLTTRLHRILVLSSVAVAAYTTPTYADATAEGWVRRMESLFFGRPYQSPLLITVRHPQYKRTFEAQLWMENREKILVKLIEPQKERNVGLLRVGSALTEYDPSTRQSAAPRPESAWLGSPLAYASLASQFTLLSGYDHRAGGEENIEAAPREKVRTLRITSRSRKGAQTAWKRVELWIKLPEGSLVRARFYGADDVLAREVHASAFREFGSNSVPTRLIIRSPDGAEIEITQKAPLFGQLIPPTIFTRTALSTDVAELQALPPPKKKSKKPSANWRPR